jgi:hypothetical protein
VDLGPHFEIVSLILCIFQIVCLLSAFCRHWLFQLPAPISVGQPFSYTLSLPFCLPVFEIMISLLLLGLAAHGPSLVQADGGWRAGRATFYG